MIGVGQSPVRDVPGLFPPEMRLIEQNSHQLRHGQGRVRVVQLNRDLIGEFAPVGIIAPEAPHEIGERARDQKVLLHKAQRLPQFGGVVGIQHPRQGMGRQRSDQCADKITAAEFLKVEIVVCRSPPQAQRVDRLPPVGDDRPIERDTD